MALWLKQIFRRSNRPESDPFELRCDGNQGAPRVLVFTEHLNATWFISFDIPLKRLHAANKVNFAALSQSRVAALGADAAAICMEAFRPDVVVMTRYGAPFAGQILDHFRQLGVPVIYQIDDDLLDLPESLGGEIVARHGAPEVLAARRYCLSNSDLVYASTAPLALSLKEKCSLKRVYSGIYAPYLAPLMPRLPFQSRDYPVVGYMGSKGHQPDLELVVPSLVRLMEERPDLHFEVFGTISMPEALRGFGARIKAHSVQKSYLDFLGTLASLRWDIGLAPLVDSPFNRCKAPTKFIEYTAAGIPVVASNIPVYADVIPEGGGKLVDYEWHAAMSEWLDSPPKRLEASFCAKDFCGRQFDLQILERQLLSVFSMVLR